jgi:DNA mismatch repair protein MutS2
VNLEKVQSLAKSKGPEPRKKGYTLTVADADPEASMVSLRLDLRGKRGEAALHDLQQYLDRVLLANLKQVEVVHGKGNGILKQLVHEYLATEKAVFHYELAPEELGGSGCTVVAMR